MSSAWWLGSRCMLGLGQISRITINFMRTKQCVLNLPSDEVKRAINVLARIAGTADLTTVEPTWARKTSRRETDTNST
jgi:hypothetical protein